MSDVIHIPLADLEGHLVDPPIVDSLHVEAGMDAYVITLVPSDEVSPEPTETVVVPLQSLDGRRIATRMAQLAQFLTQGLPIERVTHQGGGNFSFLAGKHSFELSDDRFDSMTTFDAYQCLKDIAATSEIVFRIKMRLAS